MCDHRFLRGRGECLVKYRAIAGSPGYSRGRQASGGQSSTYQDQQGLGWPSAVDGRCASSVRHIDSAGGFRCDVTSRGFRWRRSLRRTAIAVHLVDGGTRLINDAHVVSGVVVTQLDSLPGLEHDRFAGPQHYQTRKVQRLGIRWIALRCPAAHVLRFVPEILNDHTLRAAVAIEFGYADVCALGMGHRDSREC